MGQPRRQADMIFCTHNAAKQKLVDTSEHKHGSMFAVERHVLFSILIRMLASNKIKKKKNK